MDPKTVFKNIQVLKKEGIPKEEIEEVQLELQEGPPSGEILGEQGPLGFSPKHANMAYKALHKVIEIARELNPANSQGNRAQKGRKKDRWAAPQEEGQAMR